MYSFYRGAAVDIQHNESHSTVLAQQYLLPLLLVTDHASLPLKSIRHALRRDTTFCVCVCSHFFSALSLVMFSAPSSLLICLLFFLVVIIVISIPVITTNGGMVLLAFSCSCLFTVQGLQEPIV